LKHPLLILCGLVVVVLFTALIAPFLINWTAYRAEIESEAGRILGRQVTINGDIDIRLLPSGVIRLGGVEVKSPHDPRSAALASIDLVKARLALAPLLRGKFQFIDVELVRPTFRFEVSTRGVPNWEIETTTNFGGLIAPTNIILDDVLITGGSVFFQDAKRQVAYDVSSINARVQARALVGPYAASGELVVAGKPLEFALRAGRASNTFVRRVNLRLITPEKEDEQIVFDGFLDTSEQGPRFDGKLILNQDIGELSLFKPRAPASKEKLIGKFEADISTSFVGIRLEDIKAVITKGTDVSRFSGRAQALWQDSSEFIVELASKRLDLDNILELSSVSRRLKKNSTKQKNNPEQARLPTTSTAWFLGIMSEALPGLWRNGFDGRVSLDVDTVMLGGLAIEKTTLKLRFADNHIEVLEASGNLPGQSKLAFKGLFLTRANVTNFDGTFSFKAANAKGFARWAVPSLSPLMGTKVSGHNGTLSARGNLRVGPKSIDLLDMELMLDETQGSAGLSYALRDRPAFGLALSIDQIDLDRYFPPQQNSTQTPMVDFAGTPFVRDIANLFVRFDANIRLSAEKLISRGIATRGFAADVGLEAGRLTINKLNFADIGGGSLTTKGTIVDINGKPTGKLEASLVALDPTDLFGLLGIGKSIQNSTQTTPSQNNAAPENFGPLNIGVSFEAFFKDAQPHRLFKVTGSAGGTEISSEMKLLGELNDVAHSKIDFSASAVNKDGAKLLAQLGWLKPELAKKSSQSGIIRARIKGDVDQRLEIAFGLQAFGTRANMSGSLASIAGVPLLEADVTVESEDARPLLAVFKVSATTREDKILPLSFHGLMTGKIPKFVLTGFNGHVGETPVSLNGSVILGGAVPQIKASVQTEEISFPWMFNAFFGGVEDKEPKGEKDDQVWSAQPFNLSRLKAADVDINLQADRIITATTSIEGVRVEFNSQRGRFDLKRFSGRLYGGELNLKATVDDVDGRLKLTSEYSLIDGELDQIAKVKEKRWAIGGKTYISGHAKAEGRSVRGLISSMQGAGVFKIQNGVLNGINPSTFAKALASVETETELNSIIGGILAEGKMSYGDIDSSFTINSGLVGTTDLRFKSQNVTGKTSLVVDLTVFKLDNEWRFSFDDFPNSPPLLLLYTGAINAPDRNFNAEGLRGFLVVKTLQEGVRRLEKLEEEERKRLAQETLDVRIKQQEPVKPKPVEIPETNAEDPIKPAVVN